ncbi:MAG: ferritin-like domain-containing protein [Chloroflexia bacterium]|nr:ferritin-like domain-containing protein [Chloroflexia bacterium]
MPVRAQDDAAADAELTALQDGLDACCTLQAAAVTFAGVARQLGADGGLDLGPETVRFLRAAQCQDEAHYHVYQQLGARAFVTEFAMPAGSLASREAFLRTLIELEEIAVGAAMAMARRFAEYADFNLVEIAYQMGAVDAQHQALARHLLGERPANERAFARWRFFDLLEVEDALFDSGFLDGGDDLIAFPGPVARNCAGVFGLVPETTDDARRLLPPAETPDATPAAGEE